MIESNSLTKEELIANLYLTDELINEIEIIDEEIKKKNISLQATVEESQSEFLKTVENEYYKSDDYQLDKEGQNLTEKMKRIHNIVILVDAIVCIALGYLFIYLGMPFWGVVIFWLTVPLLIYLIYRILQKHYLDQRETEKPSRNIEIVLEEAKQSSAFQRIPDSLLATHIKQEITKLYQKRSEGEQLLAAQTILPPGYQLRAKEVVWYLENMRADNLKEAIAALDEDDYRQKMEQMMEIQNNEIKLLKDKIDKVIEENWKIIQQQEQLIQQESRREKNRDKRR